MVGGWVLGVGGGTECDAAVKNKNGRLSLNTSLFSLCLKQESKGGGTKSPFGTD